MEPLFITSIKKTTIDKSLLYKNYEQNRCSTISDSHSEKLNTCQIQLTCFVETFKKVDYAEIANNISDINVSSRA